jgi:hypothetical protein
VKDYDEFMETDDMDVFIRMHTNAPMSSYTNVPIWEYIFQHCHIIAPLRHPHQVFISHLAREYPNAMDMVVESWKNMKEVWYEVSDMFWFDIDCKLEKRRWITEGACCHIGRFKSFDAIDEFSENWEKVNTVPNHNEVRRAYSKTGRLPTGHDYTNLDTAINWYELLMRR